MADNLLLPVTLDRVLDSNGDPVPGAKVHVYDAGTTDAKNVYTDIALTQAAANPIVADSGGYLASRYIGTGSYKLVITTSADVTIKTEDNLPGALDTSSFLTGSVQTTSPVTSKASNYTIVSGDQNKIIATNPTGGAITHTLPDASTVGDGWRVSVKHTGTANTVTIATTSSQTIDGADEFVLNYYGEMVTFASDEANWHIAEDGRRHVPAGPTTPQGRLTLSSGVPVVAADVNSATSVYYLPCTGNLLPIWDGARFNQHAFAELTLTLHSSHSANGIFDVFGFLDGSTVRIGTGPAWSTATAGSGARGSGAGTTELEYTEGLLTNAVSMTARNGASTYSVGANEATYLGSLHIDATQGQVSCHRAYGQSRKWGVWNAYNRRPIVLMGGDGTASWNYNTATTRASNGDATNALTPFCGLAEEPVEVQFRQKAKPVGAAGVPISGIGVNSTSASTGFAMELTLSDGFLGELTAAYLATPFLGINGYTALEKGPGGGGTVTWYGTISSMLLTARYMG